MRIAVTRATGMLGHHVAREAHRAGHDVIALYRNLKLWNHSTMSPASRAKPTWRMVGSLRRSVKGAGAVIHCAAYYPGTPKPLVQEMQTATRLMQNFYAACAALPLKKIVYVGAAIALPKSHNGQPSDGPHPEKRGLFVQT